MLNQSWSASVL